MSIFTLSIFLISLIGFNGKKDLYSPIKLINLKETSFSLNNDYIIFEYNIDHIDYYSPFYFVFNKGNRPTTKVYIYNSYDRIEKKKLDFINYDYALNLENKKYIEMKINEDFRKTNIIYYLVLSDNSFYYEDSIYTLNTLYKIPLSTNLLYTHYLKNSISFYFVVIFDEEYYLHYQTRQINGYFLNDGYRFYITNELGEIFIDKQISGINEYIKLKPHIYYYINIAIMQNPNYSDISIFKLSFLKYGPNIWIKDDNVIKLDILKNQYFTFFKSFVDIPVNNSLVFNAIINKTKNVVAHFYIKYYDSDDFECLVNNFPTKKKNFDNEMNKLDNGGNLLIKVKKYYNGKIKGVLLGVFVESDSFLWDIQPTTLTIKAYSDEKKQQKKEEEEEEEEEDEDIIEEENFEEKEEKYEEEKYDDNNKEEENYEENKKKEKKKKEDKDNKEEKNEEIKEEENYEEIKEEENNEENKEEEKKEKDKENKDNEEKEDKNEDNMENNEKNNKDDTINKDNKNNNFIKYIIGGSVLAILLIILFIFMACRCCNNNNTYNLCNITIGKISKSKCTDVEVSLF